LDIPPPPATITIQLSPYRLFYTIEQKGIPELSESDFQELEFLTDSYLRGFFDSFFNKFDGNEVDYDTSMTTIVGSGIKSGEPVIVVFRTEIVLLESSFLPELADLDKLLAAAFTGENNAAYYNEVKTRLLDNNPFSAIGISFEGQVSSSDMPA
jgi:hypothetical protein